MLKEESVMEISILHRQGESIRVGVFRRRLHRSRVFHRRPACCRREHLHHQDIDWRSVVPPDGRVALAQSLAFLFLEDHPVPVRFVAQSDAADGPEMH